MDKTEMIALSIVTIVAIIAIFIMIGNTAAIDESGRAYIKTSDSDMVGQASKTVNCVAWCNAQCKKENPNLICQSVDGNSGSCSNAVCQFGSGAAS